MSSANAHRSLSSNSDASSHSSRTSPMSSASNLGPSSSIDTNSGAVQCFIKAYQPAALCIIMPVDEGDNVFCIDNTSLFLSLVGNEILDILYVHIYIPLGLLQEILKQVQASNSKVAELEKKLEGLQEGQSNEKRCKRKTDEPSAEVRVSFSALYYYRLEVYSAVLLVICI